MRRSTEYFKNISRNKICENLVTAYVWHVIFVVVIAIGVFEVRQKAFIFILFTTKKTVFNCLFYR